MIRLSLCLCFPGALGLLAAACPRKPESIELRYRFRAGTIDKYALDLSITATNPDQPHLKPSPIRGMGKYEVVTEKVEEGGSGIMAASTKGVILGGQAVPDPGKPVRFRLTDLGETRPIEVTGAQKNPSSVDATSFARLNTLLPKAAVKPGDTWTASAPNPLTGEGVVTATCRFFRMEAVDGLETARIHQSYTLPILMALQQNRSTPPVTVSGSLTINAAVNFDPSGGRVVRHAVTGQGVMKLVPGSAKPPRDEGEELKLIVEVITTRTTN